MKRTTQTAPPAEFREIRDARRAYAAALADRLADLLTDEAPESHAAEARDIVASLYALLPAAGEGR